MSVVSYNGKKLIPAPNCSISKVYNYAGTAKVGAKYNIEVNGLILPADGSPNSSGVFHTAPGYPASEGLVEDQLLGANLRKQEAIRKLFSENGKSFEIQSADGTQPWKCYPNVESISFTEGEGVSWNHKCAYSISLNADSVAGTEDDGEFDYLIESATEQWSITPQEDTPLNASDNLTYSLSHTISATGKSEYDEDGIIVRTPFDSAKAWVVNRAGLDSSITSSYINKDLSSYVAYNRIRVEESDKINGTYNLTETWVLAAANATDNFTVTVGDAADSGLTTVDISGDIQGFTSNNNYTGEKYTNANTKWTSVSNSLITRAQALSGLTLNVIPLSSSVTRNQSLGTITYQYTYNNRPANLISGSRSESISLDDTYDEQLIAVIPIPGRITGPLLQDINTKNAKTRTLSIDATFVPTATISTLLSTKPTSSVAAIIAAVTPTGSRVYVTGNNENWIPTQGTYRFSRTWIYE